MATGSSDNVLRVYRIKHGTDGGPERILEVPAHTDRLDSLSWSYHGMRIVSGGHDGVAKVWSYSRQKWNFVLLKIPHDA